MQVLFVTKNFAYLRAGLNNSHICNGLESVAASMASLGIYLAVVCPKIVSEESVAAVPACGAERCGRRGTREA